MDLNFDPSTPVGVALIVIGVLVAVRAIKLFVKVAMIAVVAAGLYVWLGL